jgi:hypothetical protein
MGGDDRVMQSSRLLRTGDDRVVLIQKLFLRGDDRVVQSSRLLKTGGDRLLPDGWRPERLLQRLKILVVIRQFKADGLQPLDDDFGKLEIKSWCLQIVLDYLKTHPEIAAKEIRQES